MKRTIPFLPLYVVLAELFLAGMSRSEPPLPAAPVPVVPAEPPPQEPVLLPALPGGPYPGPPTQVSEVPFPGRSPLVDKRDVAHAGLFATLAPSMSGTN